MVENRYTLLRAKIGTGHESVTAVEVGGGRLAAEADVFADDLLRTRRRKAQVRAARADVLSAKAALTRAAMELEEALHEAAAS